MTLAARWLLRLAMVGIGLADPMATEAQLPVYGDTGAHDPSTLVKDGTNYFIFYTSQGLERKITTDLRNWTYNGRVFPGTPPAWTTNAVTNFTGFFWAPDIAYFNGRYNLYYACSSWGTIDSAIGLVTSPSLVSPVWTDQGKVVQSDATWDATTNTDLTSYNCIDPCVLVDTNGTVWLSFGSYSDGILVMQLDPATGKRISPNSPITKIANNGKTFFSNTTEGSCIYQHGGYYYLLLNFGGCCAGVDSTYNIRVGRAASVTGPYLDRGNAGLLSGGGSMLLESTGRFIGPGHAAILYDNGTYWFTYHYYDGRNSGAPTLGLNRLTWTADGWPALTNDWSAYYPFDTDAREHLALYNGTLRNGAGITNDASRGNALNLDGATNFVSLPLSVANAGTFAAWVKWGGGGDWQRIFDLGAGTTNYLFLTPRASNGKMRFAITTSGGGGEQQIDAPGALPTNSWCHVAIALDGAKGLLYLNGNPVGTNAGLTLRPWQTLARSNYLGKSQFAADPLFNGRLDSLRVFGRALSGAEIHDLAYAPAALAHRYSFTSNAWDSIGMAHGVLMGNAVVTNHALQLTGAAGGFVNLPGGLVSGCAAVTVEFWAAFGANGNWARVFDFGTISGSSGSKYLFFSPHTSLGAHRFEISTSTLTNLEGTGTLDNRTVCVACVLDPANRYSAIYTNGALERELTNSPPLLSGVSSNWSFIGRSLFSADAWLNANLDELRIYDGRLTPEEIATDFRFGPELLALPFRVAASNAAGSLTLSWPSSGVGFALETSANPGVGASWSPIAALPALANDRWSLSLPRTNVAAFFRLRR